MAALSNIDDEERRTRQRAVEYAQASVRLEGFEVSEAAQILAQRFIDCEITLDDYLNAPYEGDNGV